MNAAVDTLVDEIEPFLLRTGLVVRTPRGRKVTAAAYEHLGLPAAATTDAAPPAPAFFLTSQRLPAAGTSSQGQTSAWSAGQAKGVPAKVSAAAG